MLTLKNVSMYYHSGQIVTVGLSDISLTLKKGEFVGITGASVIITGVTLLLVNLITGLLPITRFLRIPLAQLSTIYDF